MKLRATPKGIALVKLWDACEKAAEGREERYAWVTEEQVWKEVDPQNNLEREDLGPLLDSLVNNEGPHDLAVSMIDWNGTVWYKASEASKAS